MSPATGATETRSRPVPIRVPWVSGALVVLWRLATSACVGAGGLAALVAWPALVSQAAADQAEPLPVPYGDVPVRYLPEHKALAVAAAGLADGRGRLTGQAVRARAVAESRALQRLEQYVDGVLERARVSAQTAERVHAALAGAARVTDTRPLSDGSVVVVMALPLSALSRAWPAGEDRWVR